MASQEFKDLLTQSVSLESLTRSSSGDVSVGSTVSGVPAHVEYARKQRFTAEKELVDVNALFFFDSSAQDMTTGEWRIQFDGQAFEVVSVDKVWDPRDGSLHHYEVSAR